MDAGAVVPSSELLREIREGLQARYALEAQEVRPVLTETLNGLLSQMRSLSLASWDVTGAQAAECAGYLRVFMSKFPEASGLHAALEPVCSLPSGGSSDVLQGLIEQLEWCCSAYGA